MKPPYKLPTPLLVAAFAAAFHLPALAQSTGAPRAAPAEQTQPSDRLDVRASRLIGMEVRNRQGESLGSVNDLVLDTQNNRVHYVVVAHGGLFGFGADLFAFPIQSFELAPDLRHVLLNVDRSALREAEGFDRKRWPDLADNRYWTEVDRRFGQRQAPATHPRMALARASELMRSQVVGEAGARIGSIDDIVIDVWSGQPQYAIVTFDRGWFTDDRLIALPLDHFERQADGSLRLPLTREQLAGAPGFDRSRWTTVNDPNFQSQMERYGTAAKPQPPIRDTGVGTPPAGAVGAADLRRGSTVVPQQPAPLEREQPQAPRESGAQILPPPAVQPGAADPQRPPPGGGQVVGHGTETPATPAAQQQQASPRSDTVSPAAKTDGAAPQQSPRAAETEPRGSAPGQTVADPTQRTTPATDGSVGAPARPTQPGATAPAARSAPAVQFDGATFDRLDTDRDGRISRAEASGHAHFLGAWSEMDRDADGYVSRAEMDAFNETRR
jgi:sporulation protein YlmC with PRC-barrel domain